MARSVAFYNGTLGLPLAGEPGELTMLLAGDITLLLNRPLGTACTPAAGAVEIIFPVDSVVAAHADLSAGGCGFRTAPREVTAGTWAATFTDPDGHFLTLLGPR